MGKGINIRGFGFSQITSKRDHKAIHDTKADKPRQDNPVTTESDNLYNMIKVRVSHRSSFLRSSALTRLARHCRKVM